jgi:adenosine deaminase
VLEAAKLGATRIGHGVHIMNAPNAAMQRDWLREARRLRLHFEVCPTSNVHTGIAPSVAAHPLRAMIEAGLSVSVSTDNRLMSGVTLSGELRAAHAHNGVSFDTLGSTMQAAARASFLPVEMRNAALLALAEWNALPHLR